MNTRRVVGFAIAWSLAYLTCSTAFAVKLGVELTPENTAGAGFSINALPAREDGGTTFVIVRDLSKAKTFDPDSELTIRRDVTFRIQGDSRLILECQLEPVMEKNVLKYRVTVAPDHLAGAHLTVSECDDYKNVDGGSHLIGGGTIFGIALDKFVGKPTRAERVWIPLGTKGLGISSKR